MGRKSFRYLEFKREKRGRKFCFLSLGQKNCVHSQHKQISFMPKYEKVCENVTLSLPNQIPNA